MLLVVLVWPLRRFPEERRVLGAAFVQLADYARSLASDPNFLLDPTVVVDVSQVLRDPQPFGGSSEVTALEGLGSQAERIRLELAAVARNKQRLETLEGRAGPEAAAPRNLDDLLVATSTVLDEVASALREGRIPLRWEDERRRFEEALSRLKQLAESTSDRYDRLLIESAHSSGESLAGQLRSVVRLTAVPAGGDPAVLKEAAVTGKPLKRAGRGSLRPDLAWLGEQAATLRANLDLHSEAFRHGVRLGAALVIGTAVSYFFKQGHRYWLPLTIMLVLRPDFTSTITRGIARVLGTVAGAGLVTVLVAELDPGHVGLTVLVIAFYLAAIGLLFANYAVYSLCVASLVVTLLAFTGQPEVSLAGERSLYTVLGSAIALVAYVVWPTWAASSLRERLSKLFTTEGRYGADVLAAWADPDHADRVELQRARTTARLARTNAEAAVDRWLNEPTRREPVRPESAQRMMAAMRAYVQAVLSLHAQLPESGEGYPEALRLSDQVNEAFNASADAIAGGPRRELPPLRSTQLELRRRAGLDSETPGEESDSRVVLLVAETDQIVNAANTLGFLAGLEHRT